SRSLRSSSVARKFWRMHRAQNAPKYLLSRLAARCVDTEVCRNPFPMSVVLIAISRMFSTQATVPIQDGARLTPGSHFPHRRLIFWVAARATFPEWPSGVELALSLRGLRIGH